MSRYFNTAGPIRRNDHYYVEILDRIELEEILILHAPRQTGETSYLFIK